MFSQNGLRQKQESKLLDLKAGKVRPRSEVHADLWGTGQGGITCCQLCRSESGKLLLIFRRSGTRGDAGGARLCFLGRWTLTLRENISVAIIEYIAVKIITITPKKIFLKTPKINHFQEKKNPKFKPDELK